MEEFSKLSIVNKSTSVAQVMHWIIPQSRLNQQCPFLEKEYPYYSTDFSLLHPTTFTEIKWRLQMERIKEEVSVNLLNLKDKEYFDNPAEVKNIGVRWTARLLSGPDDRPTVSLNDHMEYATLQSYKDSESKRRIICDLLSFESFAIDGNFIVEVKIELEHSLHEEGKISPYYDKPVQNPTYAAGESEALLYSHIGSVYTNPSLTLTSQHAVPAHSCSCCHSFHGHHPRFASSTLNRSNKPNIV